MWRILETQHCWGEYSYPILGCMAKVKDLVTKQKYSYINELKETNERIKN